MIDANQDNKYLLRGEDGREVFQRDFPALEFDNLGLHFVADMLHRQLLVFRIFMVNICPKSGRYLLPLVLLVLVIVLILIVLIRSQFFACVSRVSALLQEQFSGYGTSSYPSGVAKSLSIRKFHINVVRLGKLLPFAFNQTRRLQLSQYVLGSGYALAGHVGYLLNREDDVNSPSLVRPPVELGQPRPVKQKGIGQLGSKGQAHARLLRLARSAAQAGQ